jgi:hypothetical protein
MPAGNSAPPRRHPTPPLRKLESPGLVLPLTAAINHLEPTPAVGVFHKRPGTPGTQNAKTLLVPSEGGAIITWLNEDPGQGTLQTRAVVRQVIVIGDVAQHDRDLARGEVEPTLADNTFQWRWSCKRKR